MHWVKAVVILFGGIVLISVVATYVSEFVALILAGIAFVWVMRNQPPANPDPTPEQTGPSKTNMALAGLAAFSALTSKGLSDLDDIPQIGAGPLSGSSGKTWHDGTGKPVHVQADGRLYYNGKFIGYRDANGRITDGGGNMIGRLHNSGEYYDASGGIMGRLF